MGKLCDRELLPVEEVAQLLGVSKRTVYRMVKDGLLAEPKNIGIGKQKRWFRAEVEVCLLRIRDGVEEK